MSFNKKTEEMFGKLLQKNVYLCYKRPQRYTVDYYTDDLLIRCHMLYMFQSYDKTPTANMKTNMKTCLTIKEAYSNLCMKIHLTSN